MKVTVLRAFLILLPVVWQAMLPWFAKYAIRASLA